MLTQPKRYGPNIYVQLTVKYDKEKHETLMLAGACTFGAFTKQNKKRVCCRGSCFHHRFKHSQVALRREIELG